MKYTRYDFRRKRNDIVPLVVVLISVLIVAFVLGSGLSSIFIKGSKLSDAGKTPGKDVSTGKDVNNSSGTDSAVKAEDITVKYASIQIGAYKVKENADDAKNQIKAFSVPFSVSEGNMIKVMAGVFSEEESNKCTKTLNDNNIQNSRVVFQINKSDLCDAEIAEIVNGNLKIISKLTEKDVTACKTGDFKKWVNSDLPAVDAKSNNYAALDELKKYITAMPDQIGKDKIEENYIFLYNTLKKVAGK